MSNNINYKEGALMVATEETQKKPNLDIKKLLNEKLKLAREDFEDVQKKYTDRSVEVTNKDPICSRFAGQLDAIDVQIRNYLDLINQVDKEEQEGIIKADKLEDVPIKPK
jgi:hypothetical protein